MRSQSKKRWRHWLRLMIIISVYCLVRMLFDTLNQFAPLPHYTMFSICFALVMTGTICWFIWRDKIGMERDMDFYQED
jgi:uncharacterized membrane protein